MSLFIAFDGPNGVGKSTLVNKLCNKLQEKQIDYLLTAEPTCTELGMFTRKISEYIKSESLACLVAADRYEHINNLIQPALEQGKVVLCARYLASSLVLQRLDGVDCNFILSLNAKCLKPDLYFILTASPIVLSRRLEDRDNLTRFERKKENQKLETLYYKDSISILQNLGITVCTIDMEKPLEDCVEFAMIKIKKMLEDNSHA